MNNASRPPPQEYADHPCRHRGQHVIVQPVADIGDPIGGNTGFRDGLLTGIAGNQPEETEAEIPALGLAVDFVASSAGWGIAKPDPAFFNRITVR